MGCVRERREIAASTAMTGRGTVKTGRGGDDVERLQ